MCSDKLKKFKKSKFVQMERLHLFTLGDIDKYIHEIWKSSPELLEQFYKIYNHNFTQMYSLNRFEVVSLVSDVTHGPLVLYCFSLCKRVKKSLWLTRRHIYNI